MGRNHLLISIWLSAVLFLTGARVASAQCTTLPYNLTNGAVTDANQVMANFNALNGCGSVANGTTGQVGYYAAPGNVLSGESLSTLMDSTFGSTRGSILIRGASGWTLLPPGPSGTVLTSSGPGADPTYQYASAGSRGLFSGVMSGSTPSQTSTGFSTWLHQGSTVETDTAGGMNFKGSGSGSGSHYLSGLIQAAPTPPYTRTILVMPSGKVALPTYSWIAFGWYDGTSKLQTITYYGQGVVQQINYPTVTSVSSPTNFPTVNGSWMWLQIQDDGANFYLRHSFDGVSFNTDVTGTKSSGYLGSSGYSNVFLGIDDYAAYSWTVVSYQ